MIAGELDETSRGSVVLSSHKHTLYGRKRDRSTPNAAMSETQMERGQHGREVERGTKETKWNFGDQVTSSSEQSGWPNAPTHQLNSEPPND